MRLVAYFLLLMLGFSGLTLSAQKPDLTPNFYAKAYTLDRLPSHWLRKPKILQAIDEILPVAIKQLKNSRSCVNCKAAYSVSIKIDTVYILSSAIITSKPAAEGEPPVYIEESTTRFKFRSFLSVHDTLEREVARLIITGSDSTETFVVEDKRHGVRNDCTAPIVFLTADVVPTRYGFRSGTVPTDNELLDFVVSKLKTISSWIQKMESRSVQEQKFPVN